MAIKLLKEYTPYGSKEKNTNTQSIVDKIREGKYQYKRKKEEEQPYAEKLLSDIFTQPVGGIVDAAESAYNFVVPKDKEVEISYLIPEAKTKIGQFVRPASQFFIPYTGAYKIAKGASLFVKNRKNLNVLVDEIGKKKKVLGVEPGKIKGTKNIMVEGTKTVSKKVPITTTSTKPLTSSQILMNQLSGKATKPITTSRTINQVVKEKVPTKKVGDIFTPDATLSRKQVAGLALGAGALADGVFFAPYDPNLADLLVRFPATKNGLTQWLQTDPNGDPKMERLKNIIAGAIPSAFIPAFASGVAKGFVWSRDSIAKKAIKELNLGKEIEPKAGQIYTDSNGDRIKILDILEPKPKSGVTTRTVRTQNLDKPSRTVGTDSLDTFLVGVRDGRFKLQDGAAKTKKDINVGVGRGKNEEAARTTDPEIRESLVTQTDDAFSQKSLGTTGIPKFIAAKKTLSEKLKFNFFNSSMVKKSVIQYLDSNAGLRFLEEAATKAGVKSIPRLSSKYKDQLGVYAESRFLPAVGGMIEQFLFGKTFKFKDGSSVALGDSLQVLLQKNLGKKYDADEFFNYIGAKSLLSLSDDKFKSLFKNSEKVKKDLLAEAKKGDLITEYKNAMSSLNEFNSQLLDFAVDAGLITSARKAKLIKARMPYVPLYRDLTSDEHLVNLARGGGSAVNRKAKFSPIGFDAKAGELPLRNLFDNYIENINSIITTSYKNYVLRNTFDLIDQANKGIKPGQDGGLTAWARENTETKLKAIPLKSSEIESALIRKSKKDGQTLQIDPDTLEDLDGLTLFRSENIPLQNNQFIVFRNELVENKKTGELVETIVPRKYDVNNEYLFLTLNAISPKQFAKTNAFIKAAATFKNLLTKGVTLDPGFFAGANLLRDTFSSAILSKNPFYIPMLSTAVKTSQRFQSNAKLTLKDGAEITYKELYEEFILNGGSFGSTLWRGEVSEQFLGEFHRKLGTNYKNVLDRPKKFIDQYGEVVTSFENASRFTEYTMLREMGYSARESALAAREVAVDFGMHGANTFFRQYTSTVPFLNAGIQGIYRTVRALKNEGPKVRTAVIAKITAYVAAPSLLLHILNKDDPNYQNTSQQIRDLHYMIPMGDGDFIKIPKPFEFGAVGTILTNFLETLDGTKNGDQFFLTSWVVLKNQARLSYVPQVISPLFNTARNKTFFGSPVISPNMQNSLPDYGQSYPWSSKSITAAIEGAPPGIRKFLMSPIQFENFWNAYTGAMGGYLLDLVDETFDVFSDAKMPDKRLDEFIFIKRFLQLDPPKFTQAEADFYRFKAEASKARNQMMKFKDEGKVELLKEFVEDPENLELLSISGRLENYGRTAAKFNAQRNLIIQDKNMSGAMKKFKLSQLDKIMADFFDKIMQGIDDMDLEVREPFFNFNRGD